MIRHTNRHTTETTILFELFLRWMIGSVFIYASVTKIGHPALFAKSVYSYGLFPGFLINIISITVPYIELLAGLFLVSGVYPRAASFVINSLLVLFIFFLSINFIRGHHFDCGCFNPGENMNKPTYSLLIRDILYLVSGVYVFLFRGRRLFCLIR